MFKTRLLSGIILIAAALLTVISGGYVLFFTCLALSMIAAGEFYLATGVRPEDRPFGKLDTAGYIGIALVYLFLLLLPGRAQALGIILSFLIIMFVYVFSYPKYEYSKTFNAFIAVVYTGFMFSCLYQTRMLEKGSVHVWLIFISAWGSDTCAYCAGMLFGKHKMAPVLSPKKTWEGAAGGIAGSVILAVIYALIMKGPVIQYIIICIAGAVISMVGDLFASAVKRNTGIKDYGKLIPGHGGILDRFDSIIFTAPVIYFLSLLIL